MIHPLAVVSPQARIAPDVEIGPFCVVEGDVDIGPGCQLAAGVVIKSGTCLGPNNRVHEGAVLGGSPQHLSPPAVLGTVVIGSGNVLRENVTIHRALKSDAATVVGDNNLLMVNAHVAHDCRLGNNIVAANNVLFGGHVTVDDRAFVSGAVAVHQFCRIGRLAMVGGQAHVVRDVPPFVTVDGLSSFVVGLNLVGLRRASFTPNEVLQLKAAYKLVYRSGLRWLEILDRLAEDFAAGPAAELLPFFRVGKRGFVQERRVPRAAILKLRRVSDWESETEMDDATGQRKVG